MYVNNIMWVVKLNGNNFGFFLYRNLNFRLQKYWNIFTYRLHMDVTVVTPTYNTLIVHDILRMWLWISVSSIEGKGRQTEGQTNVKFFWINFLTVKKNRTSVWIGQMHKSNVQQNTNEGQKSVGYISLICIKALT